MVPFPGWPLVAAVATPSTTFVVSLSGGGTHTDIETALAEAPPGARIEIHDGGAFGQSVRIDRAVTLVGVGPRPVLTSDDPGQDDGVFRIDAPGEVVRFENLAFDGRGTSRAMK